MTQPILTHLSETFQMPGLSKYTFNMRGECYNAKGDCIRNYRDKHYNIWDDHNNKSHVSVAEIIQYGKHLASLEQYTSGGLQMKLQSKIK